MYPIAEFLETFIGSMTWVPVSLAVQPPNCGAITQPEPVHDSIPSATG